MCHPFIVIILTYTIATYADPNSCIIIDCDSINSRASCVQSCCCSWCNGTSTCALAVTQQCSNGKVYTCDARSQLLTIGYILLGCIVIVAVVAIIIFLLSYFNHRRRQGYSVIGESF